MQRAGDVRLRRPRQRQLLLLTNQLLLLTKQGLALALTAADDSAAPLLTQQYSSAGLTSASCRCLTQRC
jgi:hypothetical protein